MAMRLLDSLRYIPYIEYIHISPCRLLWRGLAALRGIITL
jgi:hypothetical protein